MASARGKAIVPRLMTFKEQIACMHCDEDFYAMYRNIICCVNLILDACMPLLHKTCDGSRCSSSAHREMQLVSVYVTRSG